jgi:hypothetical protein
MKKFTPAERRQLKLDGYTDEEILRMEMETEEPMMEDEEGMEEELPTNAGTMRQVPWEALRAAGQPETKRAGIMGSAKKVKK